MAEKPPALDQDGKMINPHNPDFITKVPWYLGNTGPTLKHHNIQKKDHVLSIAETDKLIETKIVAQKDASFAAPKTVFRKGACKNCGAITHKEKDCLERPRSVKKSAWKTSIDIAPDEVVLKLEEHGKLSYSAKRDQWKGYDPTEFQEVMERHDRMRKDKQQLELKEKEKIQALIDEKRNRKEERRNVRNKTSEENQKTADDEGDDDRESFADSDSGSDYDSDENDIDDDGDTKEFLAKDEEARDFQGGFVPQGGVGGNGMRVTVRNLRLREDTPKYLRNLSLDSAFYDPKSRSMRANPHPNANPEDLPFAGDNFIRYSGDAVKIAQNQVFCWDMQARGEGIDVISNPSQAELLHKQFAEKKAVVESTKKKAILEKYLDGKSNETLDPRLRLGQTEAYVEYTKDGRILKGDTNESIKTKYEEDVHINNHITVWGSYYSRMQGTWGYACCHSVIKNSICVGAKGFESREELLTRKQPFNIKPEAEPSDKNTSNLKKSFVNRSDLYGDSSKLELSEDVIQAKLAKLRETKGGHEIELTENQGKKRSYNSMQSIEITPEDMEVYRMTKMKAEDPMAKYLEMSNNRL
jgi:pre-mRNA-processing factor SLU7